MRQLLKYTSREPLVINKSRRTLITKTTNPALRKTYHKVQLFPSTTANAHNDHRSNGVRGKNNSSSSSISSSSNASNAQRSYVSGHDTKREGFFDQVKKQVKQELAQDKEFAKVKEELEKDATLQRAKKTAEAAKKVTGAAAESIGSMLDKTSLAIAARSQKILDNKFVSSAVEGVGKSAETVAEQRLVKFVLDEYFVDEQERAQFHFHFRSGHGRKKDAERGVYYNPYTQQMENMEDVKVDEESLGVSLYDSEADGARRRRQKFSGVKNALQSVSERMEGSRNPLVNLTRRVVDNTKGAVDKFGDSVFKANEHTEAIKEFYERNDTFNLETFLKDVEYIMVPRVLQAYFEDDVDTLRHYVTDECWRGHLFPRVQARVTSKVKFDTAILDIRDVDLMSARYLGDSPVMVISSQMQYIYCVKDKMGEGEIVEGGRDDIRSESIFWVFRQDPTGETNDFEIMEMSFGGSARIT